MAGRLERPGSPQRTVTLERHAHYRGVFEATLANLGEGTYRVWLAGKGDETVSKEIRVVAPPGEMTRLEMDRAALQTAADISGGKFVEWPSVDSLLDQLPPGRQVRIESLPPESLWNSPILATLFVSCLVMEWLLRKRWGLA